MSSGWGVYYVVFLSALLALGLPLFLQIFAALAGRPQRRAMKPAPEQPPRTLPKMNTRFFLAMNATLVFVILSLALIPFAGSFQTLREAADSRLLLRWILVLLSVGVLAGLGLFYAARKGDLSWLKSFNKRNPTA